MSKDPRRVLISEERELEEKKKNKYTELYVYDTDFLDEYKQQIVDSFTDNPDLQTRVRESMTNITEFVVGDRVRTGQSRLILSKNQIHMDIGYVDINVDGNTFAIKPGMEYLETNLVRTLLYAASRKKDLTGVVDYERNEEGKVIGSGLNGGIAQYLAEEITGKPVPAEEDCYSFNKSVVSLLSDVLGANIIKIAFYEDSILLKDKMNDLAGEPEFFDKFNKDLDNINKLQETVRRIKSGVITLKNPEVIARMETVLKTQQERLVETVFANVILPQIQNIRVDSEDILDTYTERQAKLLPILEKHEYILRVVAKYISLGTSSEFVSDEALVAIRREIRENGIDFAKIVEASKGIDPNKIISQQATTALTTAVGEFYSENEATLTTDRSIELSPFLRRELERMLETYDQVKKVDPKGFQGYDAWFRAHFSKVPNLDLEMERIREERAKRVAAPTEEVEPEEIRLAREAGRHTGNGDADEKTKTTGQNPPGETEQAKKQEDTSILSRKFVASDLNGQIFDQRNISLYDKAVNIALSTGEGIHPDDTLLVTMRKEASAKYVSNLPYTPSKALYAVYGDKWREVLQQAFEEGYRQGMAERMQEATQKGMKARKKVQTKLDKGEKIEEHARAVDFEELQFIHENFSIVPREGEENVFDVVNSATGKIVLSDRTVTATAFAEQWVSAAGIPKEDGSVEAFTPKHAETFANIQTAVRNNTNTDGEIDLDQTMATLESMGEGYVTIGTTLLGNQDHVVLFSEFNDLGSAKTVTPPVEERKEEPPVRRPDGQLTDLHQVVEYASEATVEEITPHLEVYGGKPIKREDGVTYHPFNDPLTGAKLNTRYRELTGEDHPMFVANAPSLIDELMANKDMLLAANTHKPEYFEQLAAIRKDLESRHPELVPTVSEEKTGHK